MKTIIYYRKSTDRDDKQANSLEHQLQNCFKVVEKYNLEVIKQIWESRSAKTEFTRPWFNELIEICKKWKIDYIIIDEPKRLSRNNIDTSRIIDLMDKKLIKGVLWSSREYRWDNPRDKFLLQLDLSLSKMDNEDRSKDVKDKMQTCINNTKRFLGKAPYWYDNITIKKWHKEIVINKTEAKIVKEIFALRLENKAFNTIAIIIKEKYWENIWMSLRAGRIQNVVNKKFYYWVFTWNWQEINWNHPPLISKETYDIANSIKKWVYEEFKTIEKNPREHRKYHLKGFIKDDSWILLCSYTKKGLTYYLNQPRSDRKINIGENYLFEQIWELLKNYDVKNDIMKDIDKDIIIDLLKYKEWEKEDNKIEIQQEIKNLEKKQEALLDMRLDKTINEELYLMKNNKLENDIKELQDEKNVAKNDYFEEKTRILFELAGGFYQSYFRANKELKAEIIKKLLFELFVNTKKELQIKEKPLLESSKILNFLIGTPMGNWTPVPALRRPCPNH
jgi:site-specific DNA recombinase